MHSKCDSSQTNTSRDANEDPELSKGGAICEGDGPLLDFREHPQEKLGRLFADGDAITCAELHDSILVCGTEGGSVWGIRHGDELPYLIKRHKNKVLDVAVEPTGTFVASCSSDCSIAVEPVQKGAGFDPDTGCLSWSYSYTRPVTSISICPTYSTGTLDSRVVCLGGEDCKLLLNRRGTFDSKNVTIHSGEGPIARVRWRGTLIAWANSKGVKIVDIKTVQKVTHIIIPPAADIVGSTTPPPCCLTWTADDMLLIGWGTAVMVAEVRQKEGGPAGVRFATVKHCFLFPASAGIVTGLAPFDSEHLSVLTVGKVFANSETNESLSFHVCTWEGNVECSECLPVSDGSWGSRLVFCEARRTVYIVAPQTVVAAERRTISDHINWLIDHGRSEAAMALVTKVLVIMDVTWFPGVMAESGMLRRSAGFVHAVLSLYSAAVKLIEQHAS